MKRNGVAKFVVQTIALGFGLLGLVWVYLGVHSGVTGIRDSDRFLTLSMTPMFLVLGGIVTAIAWQALRHFGPNAIRNVVALVMLSAYIAVSGFLDRFEEIARQKGELYFDAMSLIPLLLAYLLYRALSRKLIEMTGADVSNSGLNSSDDPRGGGPTVG